MPKLTDEQLAQRERLRREEQHAALMAVANALTVFERVGFLGKVARKYPRLQGAQAADVLDMTVDHDMFLDQTESFFGRFGDQVPEAGNYAPIFAMHAIIILELPLAPARVACFMQRAGVTEAPRFPEVEVGLWAHDGDQGDIRDANHLLLMARAEQGMRAAGIPETVITEFRESVRRTDVPGTARNVADIARWVTLVDRYTPMPRKVYDPTEDIAVVVMFAELHAQALGLADNPGNSQVATALANLRSHLDLQTVETARAGLAGFYGKELGQ